MPDEAFPKIDYLHRLDSDPTERRWSDWSHTARQMISLPAPTVHLPGFGLFRLLRNELCDYRVLLRR